MPDPTNPIRFEQLDASVRTEMLSVHIETPSNTTYNILLDSVFGFTLSKVTYKMQTGSCNIQIQKNGTTNLLSPTTPSVSTSAASQSPGTAVAADDTLELIVSSISSPGGLTVQLDLLRTS